MLIKNSLSLGPKKLLLTGLLCSSYLVAAFAPPAMAYDLKTGNAGSFSFSSDQALSAGSTAIKAVKAADKKRYSDAFALARSSGDPIAQMVVEWLYIKNKPEEAGYQRLVNFVTAHKYWPQDKFLLQKAEEILFTSNAGPGVILQHFSHFKPKSRLGYIVLARGYLARGDKNSARKAILGAWYDTDLTTKEKNVILREFRSLLSKSNHELRLWRLIHAQQTVAAVRTAELISKTHVRAAKAAQALIRRQKKGVSLYKRLPKSFRNQAALRYALARYYRKTKQYGSARSVLLSAPSTKATMIDPQAWWVERKLVVRNSLGKNDGKHYANAYKIATMHGYDKGKEFEDAEFLAGFIALRKLRKPKTALSHFKRMSEKASSRTTKAQADYWAGRAYLALGDKKSAKIRYQMAARTPTVFYGLMAREALGLANHPVNVASPTPSAKIRQQVQANDMVKALYLLAKANEDGQAYRFIWPIASYFRARAQASAVAKLIYSELGPFYTVRFAKASARFNADIDDWGYPVSAMPKYRIVNKSRRVEPAVVYGLIRQESEFRASAGSHAGARGLMQLMPGTAKILARRYGYKHSVSRLTSDPGFNVTLGTAFLGELLDRFDGSYIMTFAGYNAGPRRPKDWVKEYGDPRRGEIDPLDWVEQIPFTETRGYVKKVLQNIHVYRSRLAPKTMIGMSKDLSRGGKMRRNSTKIISNSTSPSTKTGCNGSAGSLTNLIDNCQ